MPSTWVTPRVWTAGERVSATKMNELSTDFGVLFPYTTAGDLAYRDSGGAYLTRLANVAGGILIGGVSVPEYLAVGSEGHFLRMGASAPYWAGLVHRRQGGDASNWQNGGTNNYTPDPDHFFQGGVKTASVNTTGSTSVSYPVAFTQRPLIYLTLSCSVGALCWRFTGDSTSGFNIEIYDVLTSGAISVDVNWLAVGKI